MRNVLWRNLKAAFWRFLKKGSGSRLSAFWVESRSSNGGGGGGGGGGKVQETVPSLPLRIQSAQQK